MRVIGGTLKGRKLLAPRGLNIRPTADRVREAIFNIIGERIVEARVCDLFAGTGAFGIEALSRGARGAVFVDVHRTAVELVLRNLQRFGLQDDARVIRWDVGRSLRCLQAHPRSLDLVFLDPPYGSDLVATTLNHLLNSGAPAAGAWVIAEHAPGENLAVESGQWQLFDQRRYGKSLVSFFRTVI